MLYDLDYAQFHRIPKELKRRNQWVGWQWGDENPVTGKQKKMPINPSSGRAASVTDPGTWGSFSFVLKAYRKFQLCGIGFVFTDSDPYVGTDLDECFDESIGEPEPWAWQLIRHFATYTEVSPSYGGIHMIANAKLPCGGLRCGKIEMYASGRFFTVTGVLLEEDGPNGRQVMFPAIRNAQNEVDALVDEMKGPGTTETNIMDLNRMVPKAVIGAINKNPRINALWNREFITIRDSSPSGWDFHYLWSVLGAYPHLSDEELIELGRVYRSRFHPGDPKIDRRDYWERTVANVRKCIYVASQFGARRRSR